MVDDRWDDDVFSELERLGTMAMRTDENGSRHIMPQVRVMLEESGGTARVMDNRSKSFVVRLQVADVLPALRALAALAGTDQVLEALKQAAGE
jgi:hypothetical protein